MTPAAIANNVTTYLAAVEARLDDLPDEDRRELLEDLEAHLVEVAAEGEGPLEQRLGSPDVYAAELRSSAGLPERVEPSDLTQLERARRRLESTPLAAVAEFAGRPYVRTAWWVLRGYLAAVVIDALAFSPNSYDGGPPWPQIDGSPGLGAVLVAVCVALSLLAGRSTPSGRLRQLSIAASAVIVLLFIATQPHAQTGPVSVKMVESDGFGVLQHGDGSPIAQICAYDKDGKKLKDVQLFDQDGRPIVDAQRTKLGFLRDRGIDIAPGSDGAMLDEKMADDAKCPKFEDLGPLRQKLERARADKELQLRQFGPIPEKVRPFIGDVPAR